MREEGWVWRTRCEWTGWRLDGEGQGQCCLLYVRSPLISDRDIAWGWVWESSEAPTGVGIPFGEIMELRLNWWDRAHFSLQIPTMARLGWLPCTKIGDACGGSLEDLDIPNRWAPAPRKHSNRFQNTWEGSGEVKSIGHRHITHQWASCSNSHYRWGNWGPEVGMNDFTPNLPP